MTAAFDYALRQEELTYIKQDFERYEKRGYAWEYMGVVVRIDYKDREISSDGIWGVEDDCGDDYVWELAQGCLSEAISNAQQFYDDAGQPPESIAALDRDELLAALKEVEPRHESLWQFERGMSEEERALYRGKDAA